jgi:hypothetical protein
VARFDLFRNPNPLASHPLLLDVQCDLVLTSTRWCVPLMPAAAGAPALAQAQAVLLLDGQHWVLDAPNILAVPLAWLRKPQGRLPADDRLRVESALDFMLRGC